MNYMTHIEDLHNLLEPLVLYWSEKGSLSVNWLGGDDKTKPLIGCEHNLSLEVFGAADGVYDEYFTTDENRFRVSVYIENTDNLVYRGFLLPETYSEPYEAQVYYAAFSAVDGIGLLRGKQLPPEFYDQEHYVTDVLASILKLTGITFDIYLASAIKNHLKKYWHEIVIDGRKYDDPEKYPSAYEILEDLVFSMRCQLFQSEGKWFIEGINFRHLKKVRFDTYDIDGNFLGRFDHEKNIKRVHWSPTPSITMVPGLKEVIVKHEAAKLTLSSEVYKDTDIRWVRAAGVRGEIIARHWDYTHFYPKMRAPEYFLEVPAGYMPTHDPNSDPIRLKDKLYVLAGYKIRVKIAFQLMPGPNGISAEQIRQRRVSGIWIDMVIYKIKVNETVIFTNLNSVPGDDTRLVFDDNLKADVTLEFVAQQNGYLDLEIFQAHGLVADTLIHNVKITNINFEDIDQRENFIYTEVVNENSSQVRDIDLPYSDDISKESKCFYLEKLRVYPPHAHTVVMVPIKYGRTQNGKNYSIVSVEGAAIIEQYPDKLALNIYSQKVKVLDVIYNLNGGEEMAIETEQLHGQGNQFYVVVQAYREPTIDRTEWLKWTDAVYNIEQKPYAQVVAEIEGKLFKDPHLMIEATVQNPIKFNDLVEFTFKGEKKYFVPTNVEWNPDDNESQVTLIEGVYAGASLGNIPPYIDAGPDIFIGPNDTTAQVTEAVANDPDGIMQSLLWEKLSGDAGEGYSSASALNPLISGLTGDLYTFRLTGTDNSGATASDTMRVIRRGEYEIQFELLGVVETPSNNQLYRKETYQLKVVPDLPAEVSLNISYEAYLKLYFFRAGSGYVYVQLQKEGSPLEQPTFEATAADEKTIPGLIQYVQGQDIKVILTNQISIQNSNSEAEATSRFTVVSAEFVNGNGSISNLPAMVQLETRL